MSGFREMRLNEDRVKELKAQQSAQVGQTVGKTKKQAMTSAEKREEYIENRRNSFFASRNGYSLSMTGDEFVDEDMGAGIDIIKKRRGSIFGNNSGTTLGN